MLGVFSKLFDSHSRTIDLYKKVVAQVHTFDEAMTKMKDKDFSKKTMELKARVANGESLDVVLPEAYALVREAAKRTIGQQHYDVQLMAGIAFHQGKVAEQKTGEGKTLSATLPLYLNALSGKGAHLVTVNDYLAQLGAGWMGPVYHLLGVSVGVIIHDKSYIYDPEFNGEERGDDRLEHFREVTRKEAYGADVTYGTNNEFGFDYLRDNMVQKLADMVQRGHNYAIVDEADSILIDEARTPLIISAPDTEPTTRYYDFAKLVTALSKDSDYKVDEKMKTVVLTDLGVKRVEKKLGVNNLYEESFDTIHHIEAALKAMTLFHRDKEYIVRNGEVIIVDEHTGRLMHGRRYSDGLHQAIEAKEDVQIQQESRTLATISLQNYFRMYTKLAGMSGTAVTESEEFNQIYKMDVVPIPTHRGVVRQDNTDLVYKNTRAKYSAIVKDVEEIHAKHQPILIGTRSIDHNQVISELLTRSNIPHQVLNAKNNEKEAFIIADAGRPDSITVATNIAGRGVDIILGGAKPEVHNFKTESAYKKALEAWEKRHEKVVSMGGLYIIGTERHESRRIDNQLRGRAGRQGDPGASRFYVSLEDEIMRLFGGDQISRLMTMMKMDENEPIDAKMVGRAIEQAQIKVEGFFFDQRKRLVELDDVMNKQREIIYKRRHRILEKMEHPDVETDSAKKIKGKVKEITPKPTLKQQILSIIDEEISHLVMERAPEGFTADEIDAIVKEFVTIIPFDDASEIELRNQLLAQHDIDHLITTLQDIAHLTYEQREEMVGHEIMREIESFTMLQTIDELWMDHLDAMDNLRDGIWLRGDKQTSNAAYKKEAFDMFEKLISTVEQNVARKIFRMHATTLQTPPPTLPKKAREVHNTVSVGQAVAVKATQAVPKSTNGSIGDLAAAMAAAQDAAPAAKPGVAVPKVGRNDLCPCGSGKKYKKCHGAN